MNKLTSKHSMLLLAAGLLLPLAVSYAAQDADGDSVPDPIDLCPDTDYYDYIDGYVRANGCTDKDGDGYFPQLPETNSQYDPNDGNGCHPNRKNTSCQTNDQDSDGLINREDPAPRDSCVPSRTSAACRASQSAQSLAANEGQQLDYLDPYTRDLSTKKSAPSSTSQPISARSRMGTKTVQSQSTLVPDPTPVVQPVAASVMSTQQALEIVARFERAHYSAGALHAVNSRLYEGMKLDASQKEFSYYNTIVSILNILEYNDIIKPWKSGYQINESLADIMITEDKFIQVMSRLSTFVAAKRVGGAAAG